jgi:hypothetical protein
VNTAGQGSVFRVKVSGRSECINTMAARRRHYMVASKFEYRHLRRPSSYNSIPAGAHKSCSAEYEQNG